MSILLTILILAAVCWFVFWLLDQIAVPPFPSVVKNIFKAIVAILVIIKVLALVGINF